MIKFTIIFLSLFVSSNLYAADWSRWKFFFCPTVSNDTPQVLCRYCQAVGYVGVGIKPRTGVTTNWLYANNSYIEGLQFWLINPEYYEAQTLEGRDDTIDTTNLPSAADQTWYKQMMVHDSGTTTFPNMLANGWNFSATEFRINWNLQNQWIITKSIANIQTLIDQLADPVHGFTYVGYQIDVPRLTGDFNDWNGSNNDAVNLPGDSGTAHGTVTNTYGTFSTGRKEFYEQLNGSMTANNGINRFVVHPW